MLYISSIIKNIPDESWDWIKDEINRLKTAYKETEELVIDTYTKLEEELHGTPFKIHRKKFAQAVFENTKTSKIANILFAMLDGKGYSNIIWKLLKPTEK